MPKAEPSFDSIALLKQVQLQDIGLRVTTNNAAGFLRHIYATMRANPSLRCHAYADPRSPLGFYLLKMPLPTLQIAEAATNDDAE